MVLDDFKEERIRGVFKIVAQYKEDSKEALASATETMNALVEELAPEKKDRKAMKESVNTAFKEYMAEIKGKPDSLPDALVLINVVCKGTEE